jgi:hypothetical protein
MPQPSVTEDHGTPIFDALTAEIGIEWGGWFDSSAESEPAPDS